jgi:hypothetical protein
VSDFESGENQAAAEAPHVEQVHFVALDLPSGYLRMHTRVGSMTWGGFTWLGVGQLGDIGDIDEDAMLRPNGTDVTLSGVDAALVSAAMTEKYHGRAIAVYWGCLDPSTQVLVSTPETIFAGLMDYMECHLGAGTGSISVHAEGDLARWQRHRNSLYSHESQSANWPGDRGFDQIPFMQTRKIDWRRSNVWQSTHPAPRSAVSSSRRPYG